MTTQNLGPHLGERREKRYEISVTIEVSGVDANGELFRRQTRTRDISPKGCSFWLQVQLNPDDMIAVRILPDAGSGPLELQTSIFQVVRFEAEREGWLIGAWAIDPESAWVRKFSKMWVADTGRENVPSPPVRVGSSEEKRR